MLDYGLNTFTREIDTAIDDLHNQFHALNDAFCGVTDALAKTPAYDLAVTHKKELKAISSGSGSSKATSHSAICTSIS